MVKNRTMTFWEHVYELRRRVFIVAGAALSFSILGYLIFPFFFDIIYRVIGENLYVMSITEGFVTRLRIAVMIGAFFTIPVFLFETVLFVFPGLKKGEKTFMLLLLIGTFSLFGFGVAFAFEAVLPAAIRFFKSPVFFPQNLHRLISYQQFIAFFFQFLLGFGLCFEFPVVILFLLKLGIFSVKKLVRFLKYFIIIAFTVAAFITPSVDIFSQTMMALPMILLYLLTILAGVIFRLGER